MFNVMIVDDMEIMRSQIKRLPTWGEETGFIIIDEAEDGKEALEKLETQRIDLLITDIKMPIINGIELLKEVKEKNLAHCTIFLSDYSEFAFAKKGLQYDVFDYLIKPVDKVELLHLLKRVKLYIEEKEKVDKKIKELEDKVIEEKDIYYPKQQIDFIIDYISEAKEEGINRLNLLIDDSFEILDNNSTKINLVMEKVYGEILEGVKDNHPWILNFIDFKSFADINLREYEDIKQLKEEIIEKIKELVNLINKYILRSDSLELIKSISKYIVLNIEEDISIGTLGERFFLSKNYIGDLFKQETGMSIGEYIINIKMERAKFLILEDKLKTYEIAEKLNYKTVEYFSKTFKKYTGFTPGKFKEKNE